MPISPSGSEDRHLNGAVRHPASRTRATDHDWVPGIFKMLSLVAVLMLGATGLALILSQKATIDGTRQVLFERCQVREAYDRAAQDARRAQIELFRKQMAIESENTVAPPEIRRQRVEAYQDAVVALEDVVRRSVLTDCEDYLRG